MEGEAGIGKRTAWLHAIGSARAEGFPASPAVPRQRNPRSLTLPRRSAPHRRTVVSDLPAPAAAGRTGPRDARADDSGPAVEPRAVAAAFLSVVHTHADATPVLIAIDDVQWVEQLESPALLSRSLRLRVVISFMRGLGMVSPPRCSSARRPSTPTCPRVYRKLGIHTRAELARLMSQQEQDDS